MILDKFKLDGKVAIVTGSSTGLGQGMCIALADAGAKVVGVDYVASPDTAKRIKDNGGEFHEVVANLMSIEPLDGIIEETVKTYGRIDILVNNAGIIRREDAVEFSEKNWDDVLAINAKTVFFFSQKAANQMIKEGHGGKIISVASMLSYQGGIRVPSYTASKSAVKGITMSMANEWAKYGINVNAIAPGYMATNNTQALRQDKDRSEAILDRIPAGRWGTPDDMMGTIVFLSSEASNYINGFTIAVDGGWLGR